MPLTQRIGIILIVSLCWVGLAQAEEMSGVMMVVKGDVKVTSKKDNKTDPAKIGKKVFEGDTITTGPDSRAKIVMSDKNVINLTPDSKVIIAKYESDAGKDSRNVELNVLYGKVRASVEQKYDGEKNKFNVKTPAAVAGVRGTDFITGYNPATKQSKIVTFTGTVAVGQPGPGGKILNPVFVQPGQSTSVGEGKPPEAPKAVPKEELNKMNNESKSEQAPSGSGQAKNEGGDKKDKKKDGDAEEKKEAKSDQKNKEDGQGDDQRKDAKRDQTDDPKNGEKGPQTVGENDQPKIDNKSGGDGDSRTSRGPASIGAAGPMGDGPSAGDGPAMKGPMDGSMMPPMDMGMGGGMMGPSMIDTSDLGPELIRDISFNNPPPPIITNFTPVMNPVYNQPPPAADFINNVIGNQKTRVFITIQTQ